MIERICALIWVILSGIAVQSTYEVAGLSLALVMTAVFFGGIPFLAVKLFREIRANAL